MEPMVSCKDDIGPAVPYAVLPRLMEQLVLPRLMEQIVSCKDDIAQQYLMQCVIQCFPDAFHLGTLDALLDSMPQLQPGVKIHTVLASLMDRLAKYAQLILALMRLLEMKRL
eukprot:gene13365-19211_t